MLCDIPILRNLFVRFDEYVVQFHIPVEESFLSDMLQSGCHLPHEFKPFHNGNLQLQVCLEVSITTLCDDSKLFLTLIANHTQQAWMRLATWIQQLHQCPQFLLLFLLLALSFAELFWPLFENLDCDLRRTISTSAVHLALVHNTKTSFGNYSPALHKGSASRPVIFQWCKSISFLERHSSEQSKHVACIANLSNHVPAIDDALYHLLKHLLTGLHLLECLDCIIHYLVIQAQGRFCSLLQSLHSF
mmetsp:Transcript_3170/g.7130  ORF Transcript_3170/g.7130 Transcript_3170/m.7130 type:complete len:246 (-) Transcript_3170:191-928(-)